MTTDASAAPIPNEPDSCFSEAVLSDDIDLVKRLLTVGSFRAPPDALDCHRITVESILSELTDTHHTSIPLSID
jgi:hypothetical protein